MEKRKSWSMITLAGIVGLSSLFLDNSKLEGFGNKPEADNAPTAAQKDAPKQISTNALAATPEAGRN